MMKKLLFVSLAASAFLASPAQAQLLGPTPYTSAANSPFVPATYDYFFLEDVEDSAVNTPGLAVTGSGFCITGATCFAGSNLIDSVGNGGNGTLGRSIFANGSLSITFDAAVLGSLPTSAGLVWTDGNNPITFEAFDQNGISLGILVGDHATAGFTGQTDEDRFYGVNNPGGISRLTISNPPGIEIDHVQYGGFRIAAAIPEPGTWGMMLGGLLMAGAALRSRRRGGLAAA